MCCLLIYSPNDNDPDFRHFFGCLNGSEVGSRGVLAGMTLKGPGGGSLVKCSGGVWWGEKVG